ncbi:protein-arginine deiminase type-2-like [Larimichthys crocea]|uniref:protein-arginine deiminase type-2-like n=1 Tax=Larimichthys crocea TaxID=215358 RepID=UPI000F5E0DE6|nr:protein-arginine deiminase type-2-like [Larimichthys crocea]
MIQSRTLRVDYGMTTSVVYVVGTELNVNPSRGAPPSSKFFSVKASPNVNFTVHSVDSEIDMIPPPPLSPGYAPPPFIENSVLSITMSSASEEENDSKLSISYYDENQVKLEEAVVHLTAVEISLDVDADRDGVVEKNNPNKGSWKWGPDGHGAILLVNCDCERTYWKRPDLEQRLISEASDIEDMSLMVLRTRGPAKLPEGYKLTMHISQGDGETIRVYRFIKEAKPDHDTEGLAEYPLFLDSAALSSEVPYSGGAAEMKFYVEGLKFLDKDFDGLITINLSLLKPISKDVPETPIFTDKVVFKVAPWIMTPNILQPEEVFVCSTSDNSTFLEQIKNFVQKSGCHLRICSNYVSRGDRWIQDEMEFGYIDSPHQQFPVVLDSPRDRGLVDFPLHELLGPDFGYVTRVAERKDVSSLDSFGNLDVSPPVIVNGKNYPLGRILLGVAFPTATGGRSMTKVVQDFLRAQKVQEPIALFTDWLLVGHVDEFMTFVPAPDRKGFRLLLASPDAAYKLFKGLQKDGHGQAKLFEGVEGQEPVTVDEVLSNDSLLTQNKYVQSCIDWNRDVLKRELGLVDWDIIDVPILFRPWEKAGQQPRAVAYYPDMVNMIVLGKNLGIPKPFGPKVNGRCALEAEMCSLLEGLGLSCTFIDDFTSYHQELGEVHCGTNVRRKWFDFKWWNLEM